MHITNLLSRTTSSFSSMHPPSLEYYYAKEYPNYPYQHVQNLLLALVMDTTLASSKSDNKK